MILYAKMLSEQVGLGYLRAEGCEDVERVANLQSDTVGCQAYPATSILWKQMVKRVRKGSGIHLDASELEQPAAFLFVCLFQKLLQNTIVPYILCSTD